MRLTMLSNLLGRIVAEQDTFQADVDALKRLQAEIAAEPDTPVKSDLTLKRA
jgi:hypothetical protein